MSLVVDASVALAWCFEDEHTPQLKALLDRVILDGGRAPSLWPLEVANALLVADRRGRVTPATRHQLSRFLSELPIEIDPESTLRVWSDLVVLAERRQLTVYDAAYLDLALRLGLPLASCDRALRRAAEALAVEVLPPG